MANEVRIKVGADDDATKDLSDMKASVTAEGEKLGTAAGTALVDALEKALDTADPSGALDKQRSEVQAEGGDLGKAAGKELADGLDREIQRGGLGHTLAKQKPEVTAAASKLGDAGGKEIAGGMEDGVKGGKLDSALESAGGKLGTAALGIGATVGGLLTDAIGDALDLTKATQKAVAQVGGDLGAANRVGAAVGRVYMDGFAETSEEAAEAVSLAVRSKLAKIDDDGAIDNVAKKMIGLSQTTGFGMDEIAKAVKRMLVTGLVPDANTAFDVIAQGYQTLGVDSEDLLDTFSEYSVQFQKLGLDGPAALALISQFLQAGARDTDVAADFLKSFAERAVDMSTSTTGAFQALGLGSSDMAQAVESGGQRSQNALQLTIERLQAVKDPVEQNRIGVALFGDQWVSVAGQINGISFQQVKDSMNSAKGTADNMVTASNPIEHSWTKAWRNIANAISDADTELQKAVNHTSTNGPAVGVARYLRTMGVPGFASGGPASGMAMVGEQGPELVNLPTGSHVMNAGQSAAALSGGGGTSRTIIELRSSGRQVDDVLLDVLKNAIRVRGGDVQVVLGRN